MCIGAFLKDEKVKNLGCHSYLRLVHGSHRIVGFLRSDPNPTIRYPNEFEVKNTPTAKSFLIRMGKGEKRVYF